MSLLKYVGKKRFTEIKGLDIGINYRIIQVNEDHVTFLIDDVERISIKQPGTNTWAKLLPGHKLIIPRKNVGEELP